MENAMKQHGAFSWNELVTTDIAGAKVFYADMFGWTLEDEVMPSMTYTMAKIGDQGVAGMMAMPPEAKGMPSMWGGYVTVDDVDKAAAKAEGLGAKIMVPAQDIPDVGRFVVISDPQGAMVTMITYVDDIK